MRFQRPNAAAVQNIAFFAMVLAYAWDGIDTRLIYHWQGPVFSTIPGFLIEFLKRPGGAADYFYAFIAQAYASRTWGAIVLTAQLAAVAALTQVYFKALVGRALPLLRFIPAALLLYHANLYYDRTPLALALVLGLAPAILFVHLHRRWRSEAALLGVFGAMLVADYYLAGMAIVFFAPAAAIVQIARRPRRPLGIVYLLLAAALPAAVELLRLTYVPSSARSWFLSSDVRQIGVCLGLYAFYALGTAIALRRRPAAPAPAAEIQKASRPARKKIQPERPFKRRWKAVLATLLLLLGLSGVMGASYQINSLDRRMITLDYLAYGEDWPAVIEASQRLAASESTTLSRYLTNLALHETNRLGDDMFRFPQAGSMLPPLASRTFLPYMLHVTDLCLRLGRANDAEHFGSEAMILSEADPRVYRLMARIYMVKGQNAAARKYLTVLTYGADSGSWARQCLRELDRDPQLAGDQEIQSLRRRMLRSDDMLAVWQRADKASADVERLLLDQLEQDPSNRMAFEFLMGSYLLADNMNAAAALMPRIKDMTGPAYVDSDGKRRTPRHYQEAMAVYADMTGEIPKIEDFEIQPETLQRMANFKRISSQTTGPAAAKQATWDEFRDTYFFYAAFGPGDYR
jgi:hypothetical protein